MGTGWQQNRKGMVALVLGVLRLGQAVLVRARVMVGLDTGLFLSAGLNPWQPHLTGVAG